MKNGDSVNSAMPSVEAFAGTLEKRLQARSDELEEIHLEAAIDAGLTEVGGANSNSVPTDGPRKGGAIFDDYTNPNSVSNCLSPYVPTSADRLDEFITWVGLDHKDTLLDIGSGDGRVCVVCSRRSGCRSIGIDVSPPCIKMARSIAKEECVDQLCTFYEADATIDPEQLLSDDSPLAKPFLSTTVVFLYTYPTLLQKLTPLLKRLSVRAPSLRAIVTLTYHLSDSEACVVRVNPEHEMKMYAEVYAALLPSHGITPCN